MTFRISWRCNWSPNSTDLYFWYSFVDNKWQEINTKDIAGELEMRKIGKSWREIRFEKREKSWSAQERNTYGSWPPNFQSCAKDSKSILRQRIWQKNMYLGSNPFMIDTCLWNHFEWKLQWIWYNQKVLKGDKGESSPRQFYVNLHKPG